MDVGETDDQEGSARRSYAQVSGKATIPERAENNVRRNEENVIVGEDNVAEYEELVGQIRRTLQAKIDKDMTALLDSRNLEMNWNIDKCNAETLNNIVHKAK